jgi:4,5-dihydroxyphthalate decarboxylase
MFTWRTLLGDYGATRPLRQGRVTAPGVVLDFADVAVPHKAFKRVVRDLEFDVAELALMTYLMARSRGVPLRLLPIVLFSRNPLNLFVYRTDLGCLTPRDLEGRRIGVRAYTTTTAIWARALIADCFGVDLERLQWLTYEEGHVAGVQEPGNVHRDPAHADLGQMLVAGAIDAAIVDPVPSDPSVARVVPDPDAVWNAWQHATGARTVNHVVVVRDEIAANADHVRTLIDLFQRSASEADPPAPGSLTMGGEALTRTLDIAMHTACAQHLLARALTVSELLA